MGDLRFVLQRPGRGPLDLTSAIDQNARWSTQAVGGFGSASFTLPGDPSVWKPRIPYLSLLRITEGARIVWEGEVEDLGISYQAGQLATRVQAFGKRRYLDRTTVRRIWSKRDLPYTEVGSLSGTVAGSSLTKDTSYTVETGNFQLTDLTRFGIRVQAPPSGTPLDGHGNAAEVASGDLTFTRIKFYLSTDVATGQNAFVQDSTDASTWNAITAQPMGTNGEIDVALTSGARYVRMGLYGDGSAAVGQRAEFENIRILGSTLNEDVGGTIVPSGGFYGSTILRDLIALVPGLTLGIIETGSDFTIESIERAVRSSAQSVVDEVAGYYRREPAVWEDGRFDWRTADLTVAHWTARLMDLQALDLDGSVDGIARTAYVLYTNAATQADAEASASGSEQANPFVKQSKTKDLLVQPGFPMTAASAAQLASRVVQDQGAFVPASGRIVISADQPLVNATGSPQPAYALRAGENIAVVDLPKSDLFRQGPDGETHFHIVATESSLSDGTVELQVDAQVRRTDVLLARLALATRTVTG